VEFIYTHSHLGGRSQTLTTNLSVAATLANSRFNQMGKQIATQLKSPLTNIVQNLIEKGFKSNSLPEAHLLGLAKYNAGMMMLCLVSSCVNSIR
jgi:hypothetical protein